MIKKKFIILAGIILLLAVVVFANLERKNLTSHVIKNFDEKEVEIKEKDCFKLSDGSMICKIQSNVNVKDGKTKILDEKLK